VVLTGLSNGVDSLTTLLDYYHDPRIHPSQRITHLLFNDVGSQGRSVDRKAINLFEERYKETKKVANKIDLPVIRTTSNLDIFYDGISFQQTHTMRNASVALALQSSGGSFYYSSAYGYKKIGVRPYPDMCVIDPILLPLLSSEMLECKSVGTGYTRVNKIKALRADKLAQDHLNVCVMEMRNCCICWKCARTLLTIELLGSLNEFSRVFDLDKYYRIRKLYMAHAWAVGKENVQCAEIIDLMKEVKYRMTTSERLLSVFLWVAYGSLRKLVAPAIRIIKAILTRRPVSNKTRFDDDVLWNIVLALHSRFFKTSRQ
jgi:hypothetical protein